LAVSASLRSWSLANATPDVRFQIESFPPLQPSRDATGAAALRTSPISSILLTDAELDHTLGLLILREGTPLEVFATGAVLEALCAAFPVRPMLEPYAPVRWHEIEPNKPFALDGGRIEARAFPLGSKRPRYVADSPLADDWVVGYSFRDMETGTAVVYAPAIEAWTPELDSELARADCAFVDGTFWSDDEMVHLGASSRTSRAMGHVPISGAGGSAERLAALGVRRAIYVHINNTNPVLDDQSAERRSLAERGLEVGSDGMEVEV
jgi:pyrroloquinoline quinone biosynthesis protein B